MSIQARPDMSLSSPPRRDRALRRLLVTTSLVMCAVGTPAAMAQTLPVGSVQIPLAATAQNPAPNIATITNFDITDANGTHTNYGMNVDLRDQNRIISWGSFNVGTAGSSVEQVNFTTAGTAPVSVLNRVLPGNPSSIFGSITSKSNVSVWLVNPSGITFGATGSFSGGSLLLSTAAMNPLADSDFLGGTAAVRLPSMSGAAGIVLQAGSGAFAAAGPIVVVAQNITASKSMTSTAGDVALVAASDVTVPNAFGSPLGIQISAGTTVATAKVDVTGAIQGNSVRLYGARQSDVTAALLNVSDSGTLTAHAVGGKVVIAAGVNDGTDMSFAVAGAPVDYDGNASVSFAGKIGYTATDIGEAILKSNAQVTGGGAIGSATAAAQSVTIESLDTAALTLGDIYSRDSFSIEKSADLTFGNIKVSDGYISLKTEVPGPSFIKAGSLDASTYVSVDSSGDATTTGLLKAGENVTVTAALDAVVEGAVDATTYYQVAAQNVTLGKAGTAVTQKAVEYVDISATARSVIGLGDLTLQSNSTGVPVVDPLGGNYYLKIESNDGIDFTRTSSILAGTNKQSVLALKAVNAINLGVARALVLQNPDGTSFQTASDFAAADINVTNSLNILSTAGSIRIGEATSTAGDISLKTNVGDITGLLIGAPTIPVIGDYGRANLHAAATDKKVVVNAFNIAQLGALNAGLGTTTLNDYQIDVNAKIASATSANALNGDVRLVATAGAVSLGSSENLRGSTTIQASGLAAVTGAVTAGEFYSVSGQSVELGDGASALPNGTPVTQKAADYVSITSNGGSITGYKGLTLQSNSGGVADGAGGVETRYLSLSAKGQAINFAANSKLLAGTDGSELNPQSLLALSGITSTPGDDSSAITLGIVRARRIANIGNLAATSFQTAGAFNAADILTRDTLDIASTAQSIGIGKAMSTNGNIRLYANQSLRLGEGITTLGNIDLEATNGDLSGLALTGTPTSIDDYGRTVLTANAANATIRVRVPTTTHYVKLGAVNAGTGTMASAPGPDQVFVEGGLVDISSIVASNGTMFVQSTGSEARLGAGSSSRLTATVEAQTNARLGGLTSLAAAIDVRAATGDISGLSLPTGAPDETLLTRFGRADLTAQTKIDLTAAGGIQLGTLGAQTDITVNAGSVTTPSNGAINLTGVNAATGSYALTAYSALPTASVYNGGIVLGTGNAGLDGALTGSGNVTLGSTLTSSTIGRNLSIAAGTTGLSTASKASVNGAVTVGNSVSGTYQVTGSSIALNGGIQRASGSVNLYAYGSGVADGIEGQGNLTLISNSGNSIAANPLYLRANGGAGIKFASTTSLLGGTDGVSADIGIMGTPRSLTLGTVTARSLQGVNAIAPSFAALATPNAVIVTNDVILGNNVTLLGGLDIRSSAGDIFAGKITTGTASSSDRGLYLSATDSSTGGVSTGRIALLDDVLTHGNVTLNAYGTIRIKAITAAPANVPGANGSIAITSTAGNVTGVSDVLVALAAFHIGSLNSTGAATALTALPDNAAIDSIQSAGDITLSGSNIRLGQATSTSGLIDIQTASALTGIASAFAGVGNVSADLIANAPLASISVTANGVGNQAVNLRTLSANNNITVTANRVAIDSATATNGLLTINAGATLALRSGIGNQIAITGTGITGAPAIAANFDSEILDGNFGKTNLTALANGKSIRVRAGTIAQLGTVTAGAAVSVGATDQIRLEAGMLTADSLIARNGNVYASANAPAVVPPAVPVDSPLYIRSITSANGVTLVKGTGSLSNDNELRVGQIASGTAGGTAVGNVSISSGTNVRLGPVNAANGSVNAVATAGDISGLKLAVPGSISASSPPQNGYDLAGITVDGAITLTAGHDLQAATLTAGSSIDVTASNIAWIGGDTTAAAGHYRVTGGAVSLGALGNATQKATTDVAIRSTNGAITGGSGLTLQSDSVGAGLSSSYLVLDSATGISFADGLGTSSLSTLLAGASTANPSADIGIRLGSGAGLQLGNVRARTIGSVGARASTEPYYTVGAILSTTGEIAARDILTSGDLAIDNFSASRNLTLDAANALSGGIFLSTAGELKGHELLPVGSPGAPLGSYLRTTLTSARGIQTESSFALLGAVDAGTAVQVVTGTGRIDATSVTARAGDAVLNAATDLRIDNVTASGNGTGTASAALFANGGLTPAHHLTGATLTTAGDIAALAGSDVTDTALGGGATFTSNQGGIAIRSTATAAGKGIVTAAQIMAGGTVDLHRDISVEGRRVTIGTLARSSGGGVTLSASQSGAAQADVSVTAAAVEAARDIRITAGFGTATAPGTDNGSIRIGSATAGTAGSVTLTALDGDVTGLAGSSNGLDAAHVRTNIAAGQGVTIRTGGLLLAGSLQAGSGISVEAGDVTFAGVAANNGAIDVTRAVAGGALTLSAKAAGSSGGYNGDVRLGAAATGLADPLALTSTAGSTASIATQGARGDVILASALVAGGNVAINAVANARLAGGDATPFTTHYVGSTGGNIAIVAGGDISGLINPGASGTQIGDFGRGDLSTSGNGTIGATANNGAIRLGNIRAGAVAAAGSADQIVASARSVDIVSATANSGNLALTSTLTGVVLGTGIAQNNVTILAANGANIGTATARNGALSVSTGAGDIVLNDGSAQGNATIAAAANSRIGTLLARTGSIAVTAGAGDISGLLNPGASGSALSDYGRANLTANGTGGISAIASGAVRLGAAIAGDVGSTSAFDQLVVRGRSVDLSNGVANNGNLVVAATAGDVVLDSGTAQIAASVTASGNATVGTLLARTGSIGVTASSGNVVLNDGTAQTSASVLAATNARIGSLLTRTGNLTVTAANGDISGLAAGSPATQLADYGRASLSAQGSGIITATAANGALKLGTLSAGVAGSTATADRIVGSARSIDVTAATANEGNVKFTATSGGVTLGTGIAQNDATILSNTDANIGTLTTRGGALGITSTGSVTLANGTAQTNATILAATGVRVGSLLAKAGDIKVTATAGDIAGTGTGNATGANFETQGSQRTIMLTADVGTATLNTIDSVDGNIGIVAKDADLRGVINADSAVLSIVRGSGSTSTLLGSAATQGSNAALRLDEAEIGRLRAATVQIGSRIDQAVASDDVTIGNLALQSDTGSKALEILGTGRFRITGTIKDAGTASARTLQLGGASGALPQAPLSGQKLASQINVILVSGGKGGQILMPQATVDLRGQRVNFGSETLVNEVKTATDTLDNGAAGTFVADNLVSRATSSLYTGFQLSGDPTVDVYLTAKLLRVSYTSFALFQNTGPISLGKGVSLGATGQSTSQLALELRSNGDTPANAFALFGTVNGFQGRTAGLLPDAVLNFADTDGGRRVVRITQSNSRVNGCVIGSPDRGCLVTEAPPPTLTLFDERQLQLFGVADDLTVAFEPTVGTSNEALIGDFTSSIGTGNEALIGDFNSGVGIGNESLIGDANNGLVKPNCTAPGNENCPTEGTAQ